MGGDGREGVEMAQRVTRDDPRDDRARSRRWTRSNTIVALGVLGGLLSLWWVRVNIEPSVAVGVYRLDTVHPPLPRGTLVLLPVPASVQRWKSRWTPLLKPVAAVAGDTVCVEDAVLRIGNTTYGRVYREAEGSPLPQIQGCLTIEDGEVFVASKEDRSLDSRYFGPVPMREVRALVSPLWTR